MFRSLSRLFFILILLLFSKTYSQEYLTPKKWTLSASVGNWQPHSINDDPSFDSFGAAGATPLISFGLSVYIGFLSEISITTGYWALHDIETEEPVHTIVCHPLSVELKQNLIPNSRLSAYVLYGLAKYWGVENVRSPFEHIQEAQSGWGLNFGAGLDIAISGKFGAGLIFQYRYAQFKKKLGGVEDFSGPCISGLIHFYL